MCYKSVTDLSTVVMPSVPGRNPAAADNGSSLSSLQDTDRIKTHFKRDG